MSKKVKVAILGSGNIGTDLMIKVMRHSNVLEMGALVGICLLYTSPSPRDLSTSRMPSSA